MRLICTMFEITNARDIEFKYRLLKVDGRLPQPSADAELNRWARYLGSKLKTSIAPMSTKDGEYLLVPANVGLRPSYGVTSSSNQAYSLLPTGDEILVRLDTATRWELDLVCRVLREAFRTRLGRRDGLWSEGRSTSFYKQRAENEDSKDPIRAYRGFSFDVTSIQGGRLFLTVDTQTRYVSRMSLAEYIEGGEGLRHHLEVPFDRRAAFLRDSVKLKRRCFYSGDTGKTVSEMEIPEIGKTVYQYYVDRHSLQLPPDDKAVYVMDSKSDRAKSLPTPASRLFPIFTTEDIDCRVPPSMSPQERMRFVTEEFKETFSGTRYGGKELAISKDPLSVPSECFAPPPLEFGGGHSVDFQAQGGGGRGRMSTRDLGYRKLEALGSHGPYFSAPFPKVYFLYPEGIKRKTREKFSRGIEEEMTGFLGEGFSIDVPREYKRDRDGRHLLQSVEEIGAEMGGGHALALVTLQDDADSSVYTDLKKAASDNSLFSQCLVESTIDGAIKHKGTCQHLALAIMGEWGVKPWVLSGGLHCDLCVGIDTLDFEVVYNYVYGAGKQIARRQGAITRRNFIDSDTLYRELTRGIPELCSGQENLGKVVFHKDGVLYGEEREGIERAIAGLEQDGVLAPPEWAVLEIRKSHLPLRLLQVTSEGKYRNPHPGQYFRLDNERLLLATTGNTGWDRYRGGRTAAPLLLQLAVQTGGFTIEDVAEDVFRLTHLNWSAPSAAASLPVTISLADELLRESHAS